MTFWYPLNGAERVEAKDICEPIQLYPVEIMKVGDWFHVPAEKDRMPKAVRSFCAYLARQRGIKLRFDFIDRGVKVTRVA